MNVLFLQTAHTTTDDRVFYHQYRTLVSNSHPCHILSLAGKGPGRKSIIKALEQLSFPADVVICDSPVAVVSAKQFFRKRASIVYDITEWYPSKKNFSGVHLFIRPFKALLLANANLLAAIKTDAFIFGEYYKARPFRCLFPRKPFLMLPYYPDLQYVKPQPATDLSALCRLFYAGPLTEDKGYCNVLNTAILAATNKPDTRFVLTLVSDSPYTTPLSLPDNLTIEYKPYLPFPEFCQEITQHHIFLDLRKADFENTHCLPIKLFYYLAAARPVIFSNLKAIRREALLSDNPAQLVSPEDTDEAAQIINGYINRPALYKAVCQRNLDIAVSKCNWTLIASAFTSFIESIR